jgi:hypothetical protein
VNPDRLTWIFGSSRSGSTWLLRMLGDLPSVAPIDDPHLGHHLGVWRPIPLAWAASSEPPVLRTLAEAQAANESYFFSERYRKAWEPALREMISARFGAQADAAGAGAEEASVVVKEPGSHVAELLLSVFPESRLVFLLRDGRDVVDSWLAAYQPETWAIEQGAFPVAPWGRLPLIRWLSAVWVYRTEAVERAFQARPPARRVMVRYEDLRSQTATKLSQVCDTAGIEAGASELEEVAGRHAFERVPESRRGSEHAIRSASSGGWRENLSPTEQHAMHEVMGPTLEQFGYLEGERAALALAR